MCKKKMENITSTFQDSYTHDGNLWELFTLYRSVQSHDYYIVMVLCPLWTWMVARAAFGIHQFSKYSGPLVLYTQYKTGREEHCDIMQ